MEQRSPSASTSARARARIEILEEITAEARRQLAEYGAAGLSLRAVARELGMVSSAIYRYVASRDELLTLLIVEAYDSLGDAAEAAAEATRRRTPRNRWLTVAAAVRRWALDHPHEYALLYGTPVAGYEAPVDTVVPGTRVTLALVGIVRDAVRAGALGSPVASDTPAAVARDMVRLGDLVDLDVPAETMVAVLAAWTQMFGLVSFELFNQTRGMVFDHEAFFTAATGSMATAVGL